MITQIEWMSPEEDGLPLEEEGDYLITNGHDLGIASYVPPMREGSQGIWVDDEGPIEDVHYWAYFPLLPGQ